MKQLLQSLKTGETYVSDVPVPSPKPGMALVRTAASLVSAGTERMVVDFAQKSLVGKARSRPDLVRQVLDKARREGLLTTIDAAFNRLDQPMALGYSSAGVVVEVGENLQGIKPGDRVACAGGGYAVHAEYAVVPQKLLTKLDESVDFEQAAFTTLGSIALHGFRLAELTLGEKVAVIGLGLLGQITIQIAIAAGCQVFGVDLDPNKAELAEALGVTAVVRSQAEASAAAFTQQAGFDAVLICADTTSDDPVILAGEIARDRARVVAVGAVGLNIPRRSYFEKELIFLNSRSYGPGRYDPAYEEKGQDYPIGYVRWTEGRNLQAFVDLIASHKIDMRPLISHRIPIGEAPRAYDLIQNKGSEPFLAVLLTYKELAVSPDDGGRRVEHEVSTQSTAEYMTRLGVLGAGNFATAVMLPAIKSIENISLVGIVSSSGLKAKHAAEKFGFEYSTSDEQEILNNKKVNAVAVLTPHYAHARQVIDGLEAGKHVFCEKPLALTLSELAEIKRAAYDRPKQILTVGFNRRFALLSMDLSEFLKERTEPMHISYRVNAGFLPDSHWLHDPEVGGGRIIGEACHFVDYLSFLTGASPVDVSVQALPDNGKYREDNVQMTFTYPDGSVGAVSYLANGDKTVPKERIEVFCGGRVAVLDDFRSLELVQNGRKQRKKMRLRQDKGHGYIWQAFTAAVQGGEPPIPYAQIFGVTRATIAAIDALRSGLRIDISSLLDA